MSRVDEGTTSNRLAFDLVHFTESLIDWPLYCTGISNPPYSTIVPPSFTCVSYNAVRRIGPAAAVAYPQLRGSSLLVMPATSLITSNFDNSQGRRFQVCCRRSEDNPEIVIPSEVRGCGGKQSNEIRANR
jgi:hypothetical protein